MLVSRVYKVSEGDIITLEKGQLRKAVNDSIPGISAGTLFFIIADESEPDCLLTKGDKSSYYELRRLLGREPGNVVWFFLANGKIDWGYASVIESLTRVIT